MVSRGILPLLAAGLLAGVAPAHARATPAPALRVAAASDLATAFEEIGPAFQRATGRRVTFSFGSSGMLAKQLQQGAPFDAFAAASAQYADAATRHGACEAATRTPYARGRLALYSRLPGQAPSRVADLAAPRFRRIAIANPDHAPYGQAAREAMRAAGVYDRLKPRLVYAENVRQAVQFARTGNVEVAIVALPLVAADAPATWTEVPATLHAPLVQIVVACRGGADFAGGKAFGVFLAGPEGQIILARHGFAAGGQK